MPLIQRGPGPDDAPPRRGLWVTFLGAFGLEAALRPGVDWVGVDLQHGDLEVADLAPLVRVGHARGIPVLARAGSHDPAHLARVLDAGVDGLLVPTVDSAEQAAAIVCAAHPPPLGRRSLGGSRAAVVGADRPVLLAMVETADGLAAVDSIAATDGLDGLFVGPYDLALSLGAPAVTDDEVVAALTRVADAARAQDLLSGAFCGSAELAGRLPRLDLLAVDSDVAVLRSGLAAAFPSPQAEAAEASGTSRSSSTTASSANVR